MLMINWLAIIVLYTVILTSAVGQVKQLEYKISELEQTNKVLTYTMYISTLYCDMCGVSILLFHCMGQELTEYKYKSEALIHELTSKLRSIEEVRGLLCMCNIMY